MDRNPLIASNVRTLSYINYFNFKHGPSILQHLHGVKSFTFGFLDDQRLLFNRQEWGKMPFFLRSSVSSFIQANTIVHLSIFNISQLPVTIFGYFPHLKELRIQNLTVSDDPLPSNDFRKPMTPPKLMSLSIRKCILGPMAELLNPITPGSLPILDLTGLKKLDISFEEDDLNGLEVIKSLSSVSDNLQVMNIQGFPHLGSVGNMVPASLKTLKTVRLFPMLETVVDDPYFGFTPYLEQISGKNVLETLIFGVDVDTDRRCTTDASRWAELDRIVSQPEAFPFLRRVELKIALYVLSSDSTSLEARLKAIGRDYFPGLRNTKNVEFDFQVAVEDL
jgi:hypothetical protein